MLPVEHPLAADGGPVALAALRDEPWAIGKDDSHYAELTIRACRALGGFEPDVRHRSNDLLMLLALVANGQAVTLLPDLVRADREPARRRPRRRRGAAARARCSARSAAAARGGPALNALRAALRDTAAGLRSAATPAPGSRPAPRGRREPAAERGRELGDLVEVARPSPSCVDLDGQRAGHELDRHRRLGRALGGGQRVAHHAVGAAADDRRARGAARRRARARRGIRRVVDQGLDLVHRPASSTAHL